jgi:succinate dehydrogenase / fumarate reductase cytochrome b subunit
LVLILKVEFGGTLMFSTLKLTVLESVRYRGLWGQWSWLAHRISGLAILFFLIIHVWDTANAHFLPGLYQWSIEFFKYPLVAIGEIPLMGAVLYHAINGVRITILDFKPSLWEHQRRSSQIAWAIFALVFIPIALYMFSELIGRCGELAAEGATCWRIPAFSEFQPFSEIH